MTLHIAGLGTALGALRRVEDVVAAGGCDRALAASTGMRSVAVSDDLSGPELAVRAARTALARAVPDEECAIVLHAGSYHQGVDMWSPASYVQRETVGGTGPAVEVRQVSNGAFAALELARGHLAAAPGRTRALITTGDRFAPPGFDRWRTDPGTVYGDGGCAVVLSTTGGPVAVRSVALGGDPELEAWHREGHPFSPVPGGHEPVVDLAARQKLFLSAFGRAAALRRIAAGRRRVLDEALAAAGTAFGDIDWFALPHLGAARLAANYHAPLGIDPDRTAWDRAREVGHLGAGDALCGLEHLLVTRRARPGDLCLLLGVGSGFSWGAAVVEILQDWV